MTIRDTNTEVAIVKAPKPVWLSSLTTEGQKRYFEVDSKYTYYYIDTADYVPSEFPKNHRENRVSAILITACIWLEMKWLTWNK